jgi:hypothetical protein
MVCTRLDIADSMGVVSRFLANPCNEHWNVVKWILRYIKDSIDYCLCFQGIDTLLEGFTDANIKSDVDSRKSTTNYIYTFVKVVVSCVSRL